MSGRASHTLKRKYLLVVNVLTNQKSVVANSTETFHTLDRSKPFSLIDINHVLTGCTHDPWDLPAGSRSVGLRIYGVLYDLAPARRFWEAMVSIYLWISDLWDLYDLAPVRGFWKAMASIFVTHVNRMESL